MSAERPVQGAFRRRRVGSTAREQIMKYSILAVVVVAGAALAAGAVQAKQASVAGTWTFRVEHFGLKLVLEQKKSAVTGTLDWPHGDPVKLTGMFADDTLILSGASTGENFDIRVDSTG